MLAVLRRLLDVRLPRIALRGAARGQPEGADFVRGAIILIVAFGGFMALFAAAAAFIFIGKRRANESLRKSFELIARRYGGHVAAGDALFPPRLSIPHRGVQAVVDTYVVGTSKRQREYTRLVIPWPERRLGMRVHPQHAYEAIGKLLGMQDIAIGSPYFDGQYTIFGNHEGEVRRILSPAVQQLLDALRGLPPHLDIELAIADGELRISKRGRLYDERALQSFVSLSLELVDQALGATPPALAAPAPTNSGAAP
jgi:hypothetical protein